MEVEPYSLGLTGAKDNENSTTPPTVTNTSGSCLGLDCFMVLMPLEKKAIGSICFLAGPFTLMENTLVLLVIATTATLRQRPSYLFIGSLALADTMASCFFTVSFLDFHLFRRCDGPDAYLFKLGGVTATFTVSVGSLLLTALDRYLCIHRASSYKMLVTRRRAMLGLLALWSATLLISFLPLLGWRCPTGLNPSCSHLFPYINQAYLACWTSFILLMFGLILGSYALILWKAHRHEASMNSLKAAGQARMRMDIRLARTFGLILLILVGCWLPALSFMVADVVMELTHAQQRAFAFCSTLCLVNSAVNPLLYALRCKELRESLVRMMTGLPGCCLKSSGTSAQTLAPAEATNCSLPSDSKFSQLGSTALYTVSEAMDNQQLNTIG